MKFQLSDAEKGDELKVLRIDGGENVKKDLKEEGIEVGTVIEVLSKGVECEHEGPINIIANNRKFTIPRGIMGKMELNNRYSLDLKRGDKGTITSLKKLNKETVDGLDKLGIKEGTEIEINEYEKEKTYIFKIDGKEIELNTGEAAKILVNVDGNVVQANFLDKKGEVVFLIGGAGFLNKIKEKVGEEDIIGKRIEKISEEESGVKVLTGEVITLKIGDKIVPIGRGKAEKIWVELYI